MSQYSEKQMVLFCAKPVGVSALKSLLEISIKISSIVTVSDSSHKKLQKMIKGSSTTLITDVDLNDSSISQKAIRKNPFAALCISYPKFIPKNIIDKFPGKIFNFHPARLPEYRGSLPTVWPIINNDKTADYTLHIMNDRFDEGPIIDKISIDIDVNETGWSLYLKLRNVLPGFIKKNINSIFTNSYNLSDQDENIARYYKKTMPNKGIIDWKQNGILIDRLVRAFSHPRHPGMITYIKEKKW